MLVKADVGIAAEIIKTDVDILNLRVKLMAKNGTGDNRELKSRLDALLKKREQHLVELEKQARQRIK